MGRKPLPREARIALNHFLLTAHRDLKAFGHDAEAREPMVSLYRKHLEEAFRAMNRMPRHTEWEGLALPEVIDASLGPSRTVGEIIGRHRASVTKLLEQAGEFKDHIAQIRETHGKGIDLMGQLGGLLMLRKTMGEVKLPPKDEEEE